MSSTTAPDPLDVAETADIAALLAEVMPDVAPPEAVVGLDHQPPAAVEPAPVSGYSTEPAPVAEPMADGMPAVVPEPPPVVVPEPALPPAVAGRAAGVVFQEANWRNEPPPPEAPAVTPTEAVEPGPLPAPVGVLTLTDFLGLVNWRNRPEDAKPLPMIRPPEPPPPPGAELTVAAVLSQFGWE